MTSAEVILWSKIRRRQLLGCKFLRQKPIGRYIVDFYCPEAALVIEIDGGQHYTEQGRAKDHQRDAYLKSLALLTIRFSNVDVMNNLEGVVTTIVQHLKVRSQR